MGSEAVRQLQELRGVEGVVMASPQGEVLENTIGGAGGRVAAFVAMLKEVADSVGAQASLAHLQQAVLTSDDTRLLLLPSGGRLTGLLLDQDASPLLAGKSAARILAGGE